ncbi:ribonuclease 3-like protein 2 isoform X2 [Ziziphus jujuba]|uniref:Ribonuclease 3-like protein 2 isoform X2 n=1 Tax=Ziziphus jujuba TaxID=326968 RepID=A0ABM4AHJ1_ZIZJJ|nr:ribonuclease 3-like protein 2 isoform X2 [Ziziphus jujuba]
MAIDIKKVEEIIDYKFKNKKLLEEALTHPPGNTGSPSYERLEFLGDAVIGLAISKHFFWDEHYDLSPNDLTRLRSANVNNDKLARVAAHLGLYHHVQGTNISDSLEQAEKFEKEMREEKWLVYGREKGPKFLADIVESIAAAIYVDLNFDMQKLYPTSFEAYNYTWILGKSSTTNKGAIRAVPEKRQANRD